MVALIQLFLLYLTEAVMPRVLVVDDDVDFRELATTGLSRLGHETLEAPNGLKLLGALKVDRPDVILMDVRMSWMDGISLTRSLKRSELYSRIPVIVMSASCQIGIVERALEAGAMAFLRKPFSLSLLQMRIAEALYPVDETRPHGSRAGSRHLCSV